MGVVRYDLDRRTVNLQVGNSLHKIGVARRCGKLTEVGLGAGTSRLSGAAPCAVMIAEPFDLVLGPGQGIRAHTVLGWDEDRSSVTDLMWDHLPVLGHALYDAGSNCFILHRLLDGSLLPFLSDEARLAGLLDAQDNLIRRGQPPIIACDGVRHFGNGYAEADVVLANGCHDVLLIQVAGGSLPPPSWLVGRRLANSALYPGLA